MERGRGARVAAVVLIRVKLGFHGLPAILGVRAMVRTRGAHRGEQCRSRGTRAHCHGGGGCLGMAHPALGFLGA